MEMPVIHADGCMTNLGGATCNCGALAQQKEDLRWFVGLIRLVEYGVGRGSGRIDKATLQELVDTLALLEV